MFLRLNQEEIVNMNRPIKNTEIEKVIKKIFQQIKVQDKPASKVNSIKHLGKM